MEIKFNDVSYKTILKNIDIKFLDGQIIGLTGSSGSGKTTLVEMIDALVLPTSGNVLIGNYKVDNKVKLKNINDLRFNVGLVFENSEEQIFNTTVYNEISFGMRYFKYKTDQIEKHVKDSLNMVGLSEDYMHKNPFNLSHGETKKLAIASVLAFNPEILILDEPVVALDNRSKKNLIKIIRALKARYNKTIIIVSQDTDFLHKVVDYVFVMADGQIVMEGTKYDVFAKEAELLNYNVKTPQLIAFSNLVLAKKGIKIGYRDEINDLIKDVYRYVK